MSFKDILAQPVATDALKNALVHKKLSGAYLFWGPEGVGKRFTARQMAKAVNCETMEGDSCDRCLSCRKIDNGTHPDVLWIEPKEKTSSFSIEAIRDLKKALCLRPWEGRRRIAVLPEVERATDEAQNAFLKVLEETPPSSLILLTAVTGEGVLPTVLSRCKQIRFAPIPNATIQKVLKRQMRLTPEEAHSFARLSHGSLGKALAMKEGFFGKDEILGQFLERASHMDEEREFFEKREDHLRALALLTSWFRDMWLMREGITHKFLFHEDRIGSLEEASQQWESSSLEAALTELILAKELLDQHVNAKLLLHSLARKINAFKAHGG